MHKNSTLVHDLTIEQLTSLFEGIQKQLSELKENFEPKTPNVYISRTALAEKLFCDISTIHNWTVKGKLKAYGIGARVYYRLDEVEAALIPLKGGVNE